MESRSLSGAKRARAQDTLENSVARLSCKRCRSRKVKCDGQWPSCIGCLKSGGACIIADPTASRDYTRVEVQQMQDRARHLESILKASSPQWPDQPPNPSPEGHPVTSPSKAAPDPRVAPQTGASLFRSMLYSMKKRSRASVRTFSAPEDGPLAINLNHAPHLLPPRETSLQSVKEYMKEFHVEHPFLNQAQVFSAVHEIYDTAPPEQAPSTAAASSKSKKQGLFQLNMVLAIGSIRLFRTGRISLHPFGFFTAALQTKPPSGSRFGEIEDIENLLLIAYFGIYYNIGCSVWELCRLCMRICVELQLHCRPSNSTTYSHDEEQRRRKVFWECYSLDRFASSTLGRPFAINDSMISVELPQLFDDEHSDGTTLNSQSEDFAPFRQPAADLRVSNHLLRLAKITSEIHYLFQPRSTVPADGNHPPTRPSSWPSRPGEVYPILLTCHRKLKDWLDSAPRYSTPDCVPKSMEYFELAYHKERLNLFRTAIDRFSDSMLSPPEVLLNSCVHAACRTISIFDSLRQQDVLTCTRPHTHHVFTTGLVLIFSVFVQIQIQGNRDASRSEVDLGVWWAELDDNTEALTLPQSLEALACAGRLLSWFAEKMPDMDVHAQFFGVLRQELGEIASNFGGGNSDSASSLLTRNPRTQPELNGQLPTDGMIPPAVYHGLLPNQQPESYEDGTMMPNSEGSELLADPTGAGTSLFMASSSPNGLLAGILQNNTGVYAGHGDVHPFSWPFSNMPWMEGVESLLSGYEWDMIYSGLSPLENPADLSMVE